jgi:hypothetical protein
MLLHTFLCFALAADPRVWCVAVLYVDFESAHPIHKHQVRCEWVTLVAAYHAIMAMLQLIAFATHGIGKTSKVDIEGVTVPAKLVCTV